MPLIAELSNLDVTVLIVAGLAYCLLLVNFVDGGGY